MSDNMTLEELIEELTEILDPDTAKLQVKCVCEKCDHASFVLHPIIFNFGTNREINI